MIHWILYWGTKGVNRKGFHLSVYVYRRLPSWISICIVCLHHVLHDIAKGNFYHILQNVEKWGSSSNGQKAKSRKGAWAKEIVVKFFFSPSLLCQLFLLLFQMNVRFCLIYFPRFTKWPFPRNRKEFFVTRLTRVFGVAFYWSVVYHRIDDDEKTRIN